APVDAHAVGQDAQHGDLAAVVHLIQHRGKGAGHTRHFQAHVEAFSHAELVHHVAQILAGHVHRAAGAHAGGQVQAVVVDVGDDDIACAHVAGDRRCHGPDGAGARDQHVLAHQIEGQRRMGGVAVGIEDRGQVVGHVVRDAKGVEGRNHQVVREGAGAVDAHALGAAAQVPAPGAAVAAVAAGDVAFAGDAVADLEALDFLADFHDLAYVFVADVHGHGNRARGPVVPFPDVDVGTADGGLPDADQQVVVPDDGLGDIHQFQS